MFDKKTILITGGTGSWGQELTRQLLERYKPKEIRIFSRGEMKQVEMKHHFSDEKLKFIIGDVADKERLGYACKGTDIIFHLAALKHVPVCEENQVPAIMTNIIGTQNVIDIALQQEIPWVVDVSTDKAVDPLNFYGVTKAVGEKLMVNANQKDTLTRFVCVRGGNVIGSSGSVVPLFKKQISLMNKMTITDKRMTRFLFTLQDAIGLIFKAVEKSAGGEIFVMKMPAAKISDLAETMKEAFGNDETKIEYIGIRPGEKIDEVLVSRYECDRVIDDDEYFIILPYVKVKNIEEKYKDAKLHKMEEFSSKNTRMLDNQEIKELITRAGFLAQKDFLIDNLTRKELENIAKKGKWVI